MPTSLARALASPPSQSRRKGPRMVPRFVASLFLLSALLVLAGCGGVPRSQVAGKVTYKGASVAQGRVTFSPEKGETGFAPIKDGAYDTRQGKGPSPGPATVRIEGFDGKANADQPLGNVLFVVEEKFEVPTQDTTKDFVVPANASKTLPETSKKFINP